MSKYRIIKPTNTQLPRKIAQHIHKYTTLYVASSQGLGYRITEDELTLQNYRTKIWRVVDKRLL